MPNQLLKPSATGRTPMEHGAFSQSGRWHSAIVARLAQTLEPTSGFKFLIQSISGLVAEFKL